MQVNNTEFKTFALDTKYSITVRIASLFNTLPKYLYFYEELSDNIKDISNIYAEDLLVQIKAVNDIVVFISENENKTNKLDIKKDIIEVWLAYNSELEQYASIAPAYLISVSSNLIEKGYFSSQDDFDKIWSYRYQLKQNLEKEIENNQKEDENYIELYSLIDSIEDLACTDVEIEKVFLNIFYNMKDNSLLELFNNILLNDFIPFANCKNYYKILKKFIPSDEWAINSNDSILLKMCEKKDALYKDYTDIEIFTDDTTQEIKIESWLTFENNFNQENFIQKINQVIPKLSNPERIVETEIMGTYYYPQLRIDVHVLADLIMNDKLFSTLINSDESRKATKRRSDGSEPWIYIHYNHPDTGHISASVSQKIVDRSDITMRDKPYEIFSQNDPYIRVRVKGATKQSIDLFKNIFSKLLRIYYSRYNDIVDFYREFIPEFGIVKEVKIPLRKKDIEIIAPEIFIKNYSRNCPEFRLPKIIDNPDEYKDMKIMRFPRDKQEENAYESDGKNQKYYICPNPEYPYPSLQENKLENSKEYPYVPCCFKTDQENKKNSTYNQYFYNQENESKETRQQGIITTNKFVSNNNYGELPSFLKKFFENIDFDSECKYIRYGLFRSTSSFLDAVMVSLEYNDILSYNQEKTRLEKLLEMRYELSDENYAVLAKQCLFDLSVNEIMEKIKDPEVYFDPKNYIQLLETYFDCNIFIFNRDSLVVPNHTQTYCRNVRNSKCILIYEHLGSESDHAKYPQCELIAKWNTTKIDNNTELNFEYDSKLSQNINKFFNILTQTYSIDNRQQETIFPDNISYFSQAIDSYGKTRCVNVEFNNQKFSVFTTPFQPLPIKEDKKLYQTDVKTAIEFLKIYGQVLSQTVSEGSTREINGIIGNIQVSIPVKKSNILNLEQSDYGLHYPKFKSSSITTYNFNKKMARYITEYVYWLFSRYVNENNLESIDDSVLNNFAENNIVTIPEYQYENIPKTFSLESKVMNNGKLVVSSEEMLKRLLYVLKLYTIRNITDLVNYYTKNTITKYYEDITDFDNHPFQLILQGEDAIDKWIQEKKVLYTLHDSIVIGRKYPYFFRNTNISDSIFLAQNAFNLHRAIDIAAGWQKQKYNIGLYASDKTILDYGFNLYSYINSENITKTYVEGNINTDFNILGYKIEGKAYYTVLMDL